MESNLYNQFSLLLNFSKKRSLLHKSETGYKDEDSLLLMLPPNIKKKEKIPIENVKTLLVFNFCEFFGLYDEMKNLFILLV